MRHKFDWPFITAYILAASISCAVLFSISPDRLGTQLFTLLLGGFLLIYLSRQEPKIFASLGWLAYLLTVLMLVATLLFGENVRGSIRWINIAGFQFQASEFTKPLLILAFSQIFTKFPLNNFSNLLKNIALFAIPAFLIFKQPDLGTALVITAIWLTEFIIAGANWVILGSMGLGTALSAYFAPRFMHDYQLRRLTSFLDPSRDPLGSGYNVIQSVIAVGSGRIFGKGLGHGTQSHLRFLPERHTDFIFASLAEELGLVGGVAVIVVLSYILLRLLNLMLRSGNREFRLILGGVFAYICFQTFINIGMNLGIAPVTGITLPLISYGGSSVIATGIALGIASSIARTLINDKSFEIK